MKRTFSIFLALVVLSSTILIADNRGTYFTYNSVGTTEDEVEIKSGPGRIGTLIVTNSNASFRYFRCADALAANTTPGTTTPVIDIGIPPNGFSHDFQGFKFRVAITCWLVTGAARTDTTEVAANEIKYTIAYD